MTEDERTHAIHLLRNYYANFEKLANIERRLREINDELYNIRSVRTDREPTQGGTSGAEARLDKLIDDKTRYEYRQRKINADIAATDGALQALRPFDAEILVRYYCFGLSYTVLAAQYNYSERSMRRMKNHALRVFSDIIHAIP